MKDNSRALPPVEDRACALRAEPQASQAKPLVPSAGRAAKVAFIALSIAVVIITILWLATAILYLLFGKAGPLIIVVAVIFAAFWLAAMIDEYRKYDAQAIEAATAGETGTGSTEGESAVRKDAPKATHPNKGIQ